MKRLKVLSVSVLSAALLFSCSQSPTGSDSSGGKVGHATVSVNLGKIALAKAAVSNLDSLVMILTAPGETQIDTTFILSGIAQQSKSANFELGAGKAWHLVVRVFSYDSKMNSNRITHEGSTDFSVIEGTNPPVSLSVSSQYANLVVRVNPITELVDSVVLLQGNNKDFPGMFLDDTSFAAGVKPATDTVKLYYGWVSASRWRQDYQVGMYGDVSGKPNTLLYWGTFYLENVEPGVDGSTTFTLYNYAPSATSGTQSISVTVGRVGILTVDGKPVPELPPSGGTPPKQP